MRSPHPLINQFPSPASCKDTLPSVLRARTQGLLDIEFEIIISQERGRRKFFTLPRASDAGRHPSHCVKVNFAYTVP